MPSKTISSLKKKRQQGSRRATSKTPLYLGLGFPSQLGFTHKYVESFTLTGALGVMANYRFRASGMFDPNHTGGGHQPSYYDNLAAIYDHWLVVDSTLELTVTPTASPATPTAFGIAINDDVTTGLTSFSAYEESTNVKVNYCSAMDSSFHKLTLTYRAGLTFPGPALSNQNLWGTVAADPTEETIFNVFLQSVDMVSNTACLCVAKITYNAVWFELKDLVIS